MTTQTQVTPLAVEDYEAIEAAVMETTRGRWFLAEYARRNRNADTDAILGTLDRIERTIRRERAAPDIDRIRLDLADMAEAISRTKQEIAQMKLDTEHGGRFADASHELDAIVSQTEAATTEYAHKLGLAFQLTNIIRDVGEDAMMGRIYLPVNELQQFDVKAHEILKRQYSDRFTALMRFQAERAHRLYDEALALLPAADRRAQKPGLMMASIYRTLLREIERDNFQVLHQRIRLTPLRKFWLAWKVQALGRM